MGSLTTPACRLLGITAPVMQAPIGTAATPGLAAAVSAAGGLGTLGLTWERPDRAGELVRAVRERTDRPFAANLVMAFPVEEVLAACLDAGAPVISTAWGDPAVLVDRIHRAGALHVHSVGSVEEAQRAAAAGVDVIIAQGFEAGGHVLGTTTTMTLVPAVVDAVGPTPVLAAGGIADGRGLAAVLALGGQGAWMGTRFLAAAEADTHELYRRRVLAARPEDAVHTWCFDGGWPDTPHRVLRNDTLSAWEAAGSPASPDRPGEGDIVATSAAGRRVRRYDDVIPLPGMTGDLDELALYAGQSVALTREVTPAAEIIARMLAEAEAIFAAH